MKTFCFHRQKYVHRSLPLRNDSLNGTIIIIRVYCVQYFHNNEAFSSSVCWDCQLITWNDYICIVYLLFPVEATSVTVGDVDITIRLENSELKATQHGVEQLPARSLGRKWKYRGKRWEIGGKWIELSSSCMIWMRITRATVRVLFLVRWLDLYHDARVHRTCFVKIKKSEPETFRMSSHDDSRKTCIQCALWGVS